MSNPAHAILNSCLKYAQQRLAQPCLLCGARSRNGLLCPACQGDLPRLPAERCPRCALPTAAGAVCGACLRKPPAFVATCAVYRYEHPADLLVHALKYRGELAVAGFLAGQLAPNVAGRPLPDLILPMPLHPRRLRERGFNQANEIGRHLAKGLGIPCRPELCRRVRDTPPQVGLPLKARRGNIRQAFACQGELAGRRVALVDDVMTSGASLDELARSALAAGAREVEAWIVARAVGH